MTINNLFVQIKDSLIKWSNKQAVGSFARNAITLITGTMISQTLLILVAPILTRLYSPEDFGVSVLFASLLGIFSVVVCGRYELAIPLPDKGTDAVNLLVLSLLVSFGVAVLSLVIVVLFGTHIASFLGSSELKNWLLLLPISLLATGLYQGCNYWSIRQKQFKRLAARTINQSMVTSLTQIGAGLACNSSPGGLIGGVILGQLFASVRLVFQIFQDEGRTLLSSINQIDLLRVLRRYKRFPLYDSWSGLFNTVSTTLPALLLGYFFNSAVVGFYALGQRTLSAPMGIIGGSIGQSFFSLAAEARRNGELDKLTLKVYQRLFEIGYVPIALLTIIAPELYLLIFGEAWRTAGEYIRCLGPWIFLVFVSSPLSVLYLILERQRELFIFNISMLIVRSLTLVVGGNTGDAIFAIALFGTISAVLYICNTVFILHIAKIPFVTACRATVSQILYGFPFILGPVITWWVTGSSFASFVVACSSAVIFICIKAWKVIR